jgi:hypothetical protein
MGRPSKYAPELRVQLSLDRGLERREEFRGIPPPRPQSFPRGHRDQYKSYGAHEPAPSHVALRCVVSGKERQELQHPHAGEVIRALK